MRDHYRHLHKLPQSIVLQPRSLGESPESSGLRALIEEFVSLQSKISCFLTMSQK